jgi:hypothetical protein
MLIILILALLLSFYWYQTSKITPERFPEMNPNLVLTWQTKRWLLCQRLAALYIIWVIVAIGNGFLAAYAFHHSYDKAIYNTAIISLILEACYIIGALIYALMSFYKMRKWFKQSLS